MDISTIVIALLALATGVAIGFAHAQRGSAARETAIRTEMRTAAAERERMLQQGATDRDRALRDDLARANADRDAMLQTQLEAASQRAIESTSKQVFAMADARVKATEQVVAPVTTNLDKLAAAVNAMQNNQTSWQVELKQQVEQVQRSGVDLRQQTQALADALRKPQVRGQWGELQLKRSLELAGLTEHVAFDQQVSRRSEDGQIRPDVVITLPGNRHVVVDSKVPLDAFLAATAATDEGARGTELVRHAKQVKSHIDALSAKSYWKQFDSAPEFVVMFVPNEAMFSAAVEIEPDLIGYAWARSVALASPTTLIPLLKTVDYTWKQERIADDAKHVYDLGREIYERVGVVGGHLDRLGRSITTLVGTYNKTISSVESRMLVSARRMHDLRVSDEPTPAPMPVKDTTTPITATELLGEDPPRLIEGDPGREQWRRQAG